MTDVLTFLATKIPVDVFCDLENQEEHKLYILFMIKSHLGVYVP